MKRLHLEPSDYIRFRGEDNSIIEARFLKRHIQIGGEDHGETFYVMENLTPDSYEPGLYGNHIIRVKESVVEDTFMDTWK